MASWAWDSQRRQYWKQRKPTIWSPYWGPDRFVSFQCKWIPTSWSEKVHWELEQRRGNSSYTVNIFSPVSITISLYGCNICLHYHGDFLVAYRRHSLMKKVQFLTPLLEISFIFLQRRVSGNICCLCDFMLIIDNISMIVQYYLSKFSDTNITIFFGSYVVCAYILGFELKEWPHCLAFNGLFYVLI